MKVKEQQLKRKMSELISWWTRQPLSSAIEIEPPLTEENPLWKRTESELSTIRLFGYTPEALQEKIEAYWAKPFLQRCLQRLFSRIDQEIEVLAYYKQCLAFQKIQQQVDQEEQKNNDSLAIIHPEIKKITQNVEAWLDKEVHPFEYSLSHRSLAWLSKYFSKTLIDYEPQLQKKFLKFIKKQIKRLPEEKALVINSMMREAYQKTWEELFDYLVLCYQPQPILPLQAAQNAMFITVEVVYEWSVVPVPGSVASASARTLPALPDNHHEELNTANVFTWIDERRKQIRNLLQEEKADTFNQVLTLLKRSFESLEAFIKAQLNPYQQMIDKLCKGYWVNGLDALTLINDIQDRLCKLHRKSSLLFHPDRHVSTVFGQELTVLCNQLTKEYNGIFSASLDQFEEGHKKLSDYIKRNPKLHTFYEDCERVNKQLDELRQSIKDQAEFLCKIKVESKEIKAESKKIEAESKEIEAELKEMYAKTEQFFKDINGISTMFTQRCCATQDEELTQGVFSIYPLCEEEVFENDEKTPLLGCAR